VPERDPNMFLRRRSKKIGSKKYVEAREAIRGPWSLGMTIRGWRMGWKIKREFLEQRVEQLQEIEKKLRARIAELTGEEPEPMSHLTIIAAKQNHVPGSYWEKREAEKMAKLNSSSSGEVVVPSPT